MEKKQIRKSKLWMFVFAGIFIASIILAVWMASMMPKERSYETDSGNITDVVSLGSTKWLYATSSGTVVKMADNDSEESTYNVV